MKVLRSLLLVFLVPLTAYAQHGTVHYDHTVALEFEMPAEVRAMKVDGLEEAFAKMPKQRTTREILAFNSSSSMLTVDEDAYQEKKSAAEHRFTRDAISGGKIAMSFELDRFGDDGQPGATYVNFEEGTFTQEHSLLGRTFLVDGELEALAWRLPGEERTILDYHVVKATAVKDSLAIEAWFAPEIPVPGGPGLYGGLPGLILVLSIDGGRETYAAVEMNLESEPEVEKPVKGRKVTQEEFDQIAADKLEERMKNLGVKAGARGGTTVVIKRQ